MTLDISPVDRKTLYKMVKRISLMKGQLNQMADQYTDNGEESDAILYVANAVAQGEWAIDKILSPE